MISRGSQEGEERGKEEEKGGREARRLLGI